MMNFLKTPVSKVKKMRTMRVKKMMILLKQDKGTFQVNLNLDTSLHKLTGPRVILTVVHKFACNATAQQDVGPTVAVWPRMGRPLLQEMYMT
jgi:hypothetical protein